jgi:tripartite ATP-independent transporter DctM subunit
VTAAVLFITLLLLLALEAPIAIAIGAAAVTAILVQGQFSLMMVAARMFAGCDSFFLLAVPLFMFTGVLMEASGISRRIIDFANALVGWLPGGLAAVTVVSSMFFAGISGSAAADAVAVGSILIPAMKKSGYPSSFAAAVQASAGSIGVIIPPSIPMIIFGFLTGASVAKLFAGGLLPGILIGVSLIILSTLISKRQGFGATATFSLAEVWRTFKRAILALGAPLIILGGILGGVFDATEAAAVAVAYALVLGMAVYRRIKFRDLFPLFLEGALTSAVVMFIIGIASVLAWFAAIEEIPNRLAGSLLSLTQNHVLLLLLINAVLLIAGTIIETAAALILLVPMIAALSPGLGIDIVQLGVIVVTNLAIGMLTPPMGICLIVSGAISGDGVVTVARRVFPFVIILIADLLIITFYPPITMWLAKVVVK